MRHVVCYDTDAIYKAILRLNNIWQTPLRLFA